MNRFRWIVTQIGSREHYAVPRAFHLRGGLARLYTDVFVRRRNWMNYLPGGASALLNRFHPALPREKVVAFNFFSLRMALKERLAKAHSMADRYRNFDWIGQQFARRVNRHLASHPVDPAGSAAFLFSTGALETAEILKKGSVPIIVDQLDPGRLDERMVRAEMEAWPGWEELPGEVPESYYQRLKDEWRLADVVLVNSNWSKRNLLEEGIDARKILVTPLCYEPERAIAAERKIRPASQPLTVLWLGQIVLRKGIPYLFEAARKLAGTNIRFIVAGRVGISQKGLAAAPANVNVVGRVDRQKALELFAQADVFVLPTVSDGFALTQLEAMSFGLPVITTPNCGDVVSEGVDGMIIAPRDSDALAEAIAKLDRDRDLLAAMSSAALKKPLERRFSLEGYADAVESAVGELKSRAVV